MITVRPVLVSPLLPVEPKIVTVIIQLARIRDCIRPSLGIQLVNSMIDGTPVQKALMEHKKALGTVGYDDTLGKVGAGYWRGFKWRNKDKIVSKKGQKYEMDQNSWSTYANFCQMYDGVINEFVDAGVAIKRDFPVWMNRDGNIVDGDDAFRCKVTHDITHSDHVIVMDEAWPYGIE